MSSIAQVSDASKRVLTTRAKERERETGFVERSTAQLDGPTFVHTTVFGWMDNPEASYPQLRHVAASLEVPVSSQAVEQRFGAESAILLRELLQEAVGEVLSSEANAPELLRRFNGVYVQDGTIISLPSELRDEWHGCGGNTPEAGLSSMRVPGTAGSGPGRDARGHGYKRDEQPNAVERRTRHHYPQAASTTWMSLPRVAIKATPTVSTDCSGILWGGYYVDYSTGDVNDFEDVLVGCETLNLLGC